MDVLCTDYFFHRGMNNEENHDGNVPVTGHGQPEFWRLR